MKLNRQNLRILLVDDDDRDSDLVEATLMQAGFTHPLHFSNGGLAVEYFKYTNATGAMPPHVILLDLNMPIIGGVHALKILREHSSFRDLPVIILSGHVDPANRREVTHHGIFRIIEKGLDFSRVITALDDFIGIYNHEVDVRPADGDKAASRPPVRSEGIEPPTLSV